MSQILNLSITAAEDTTFEFDLHSKTHLLFIAYGFLGEVLLLKEKKADEVNTDFGIGIGGNPTTVLLQEAEVSKFVNGTYTYKFFYLNTNVSSEYALAASGDMVVTIGEAPAFSLALTPFSSANANCALASFQGVTLPFEVIKDNTGTIYNQKTPGVYEKIGSGTNRLQELKTLVDGSAYEQTPNVSGMDFSGNETLDWFVLEDSVCVNTNFSGVTLGESCSFSGSNITGANFRFCHIDASVGFTDAKGMMIDFKGSTFLGGTNFTGAILMGANFEDITSSELVFATCDLSYANFTNAVLTLALFNGANCKGTNFTGATMPIAADTKSEFKAVVGESNWDADTTIWTDGNPIGA